VGGERNTPYRTLAGDRAGVRPSHRAGGLVVDLLARTLADVPDNERAADLSIPRRDVPDDLVAVEVELAFQGLMLGMEVFRFVFTRKYIRITMPTKIETTGMAASIPSSGPAEFTSQGLSACSAV